MKAKRTRQPADRCALYKDGILVADELFPTTAQTVWLTMTLVHPQSVWTVKEYKAEPLPPLPGSPKTIPVVPDKPMTAADYELLEKRIQRQAEIDAMNGKFPTIPNGT